MNERQRDRLVELHSMWPTATFAKVERHRTLPALSSFQETWLLSLEYANDRTLVIVGIIDDLYPEHYATLSVNLPTAPDPGKGWFYIKDWMENEGLAEGLAEAGAIELECLPEQIPTGHVTVTRKARVLSSGHAL